MVKMSVFWGSGILMCSISCEVFSYQFSGDNYYKIIISVLHSNMFFFIICSFFIYANKF